MMLKKIASAVIMSVCLQPAFANKSTPKPDLCPSIKAIQAVGINDAGQLHDLGPWIGFNDHSFYDTADEWSFVVVGDVKADDKADAIIKYNKQMGLFADRFGPDEGEQGNWACYYVDSFEDGAEPTIVGVAVTPVPGGDDDKSSILHKNMLNMGYLFKKFSLRFK